MTMNDMECTECNNIYQMPLRDSGYTSDKVHFRCPDCKKMVYFKILD